MKLIGGRRLKEEKGFTLMEIMVVVLILGLIAGYAIPRYLSGIRTAKLGQVTSNYETVRAETWAAYYVPGSTYTTAAETIGREYGTGGTGPLDNPFGNEPVVGYDGTNYYAWDATNDTWSTTAYDPDGDGTSNLAGGEIVIDYSTSGQITVTSYDDSATPVQMQQEVISDPKS